MSEKGPPQPEKPSNTGGSFVKVAMLAGILGIAVGAGLYAFSGQIGNVENQGDTGAQSAGASCPVDQNLRTALDAAAIGHMVAFKALDRPALVSDLSFRNDKDEPRSLADWQGKIVLFNLWATWCAPCRAEMPALDKLQADLGGEDFEVVPVSVDLGSAEKPKNFYREIGMVNAGFFHDGEMTTFNQLKREGMAFGLPATLLISRKGCVLGTLNGPAEWAGDAAKALVKSAM